MAGLLKGESGKLFIFEGVRAKKKKKISTLGTVSNPGLFGLQNNNVYTKKNLIDNDLYMIPFFLFSSSHEIQPKDLNRFLFCMFMFNSISHYVSQKLYTNLHD